MWKRGGGGKSERDAGGERARVRVRAREREREGETDGRSVMKKSAFHHTLLAPPHPTTHPRARTLSPDSPALHILEGLAPGNDIQAARLEKEGKERNPFPPTLPHLLTSPPSTETQHPSRRERNTLAPPSPTRTQDSMHHTQARNKPNPCPHLGSVLHLIVGIIPRVEQQRARVLQHDFRYLRGCCRQW